MQPTLTDWSNIASTLNKISQVSSTSVKKELLRLNDSEDLKVVLRLCYDPYIKFNIARVILHTDIGYEHDPEYSLENFIDDLEKLYKREITGNAAVDFVEVIYWNLHPDFRPYLEKILQKDLKIGAAIGLINDVWPELIPEFKLALCERYKKVDTSIINYPILVEPKIDGVRALAFIEIYNGEPRVIIKARSGLIYHNFKTIEDELLELVKTQTGLIDCVLDGEIQDEDFQNTMNNARRVHDVQFTNSVYKVWDILYINEFDEEECHNTLEIRKTMLYKILAMPSAIDTDFSQVQFGEKDFETIINALEHVHILPWSLAYTFQDIISYFDLWYALGAEGVIVKNLNSYYKYSSGGKRGGKIAPWWKFKIQDYKLVKGDTTASEYTVKITGCYYGEANAKYRYSLGGFHYKGVAEYKGEKVSIIGRCGGGFTDEQRDDFIKRQNEFPGMIIDIVSQEVTLNKEGKHSLRFPIFKCFRPDLTNIDEN